MFARALLRLAGEGVTFRVAIAGEPGPNPHPAMHELRDALGERVVHFGMAPTADEYRALLGRSDIIVSTTRHEFFGIGLVEAMAAGCIPVAPRQYNYPSLVPGELHGDCLWADEAEFLELLRAMIARVAAGDAERLREPLRAAARRYAWERVAPAWDAVLTALAGARDESEPPSVR